MAHAYIFPGQGAQFQGMGMDLYDRYSEGKALFEQANALLGFRITDVMFSGTEDDLKQTKVTQPAVFLHSVIAAFCEPDFHPDMVAGHSLGEFSALTAAGCLSFEDGLLLVQQRANAMQDACERYPSTMAAVLGLPDDVVERVCAEVTASGRSSDLAEGDIPYVVVPANYNCPGQLVISGSHAAVLEACERLKSLGAKRALPLKVGGAFHSPLMQPAGERLERAIRQTAFATPKCPVYQNVDGKAYTDPNAIKTNLIAQLTAPVRWTQTVRAMASAGATVFTELGPGKVLTGMVGKTV